MISLNLGNSVFSSGVNCIGTSQIILSIIHQARGKFGGYNPRIQIALGYFIASFIFLHNSRFVTDTTLFCV